MKIRAHVIFRGRVQGVFFRAHTKEKADELQVTGRVRNLFDGSVEAIFEGEKENVEEVINWCKFNQPYAEVEFADVKYETYKGEFKGFEVKR